MLDGVTVLVTGAAGFIPSHLCRRLVRSGARLFATVKYHSVVDNVRLASIWEQITPVEIDIRNTDSLAKLRAIAPDIVFHMAAYNHVGDSFTQVSEALECNAKGSVNVFEAYESYKRFVYVSTSEVYGHQPGVPFREDAAPSPLSPYAVGKYAGELYAAMKWRSQRRPVVIVRPFNAFGPYQTTRAIIPDLIVKGLRGADMDTTEGVQTREFNYVDNLVDGLVCAATTPGIEGEVINLGSGDEIAIRDLAGRIHELTGRQSRLRLGALPQRSGEIMRMCADAAKASRLLGWSPRVDFETGLARTVQWFRRYLCEFHDARSGLHALASDQ